MFPTEGGHQGAGLCGQALLHGQTVPSLVAQAVRVEAPGPGGRALYGLRGQLAGQLDWTGWSTGEQAG